MEKFFAAAVNDCGDSVETEVAFPGMSVVQAPLRGQATS